MTDAQSDFAAMLADQIKMLRKEAFAKASAIYRDRDQQIAQRMRFYLGISSESGQFVRVAAKRVSAIAMEGRHEP